jgi:hypothetical protein
MAKKEFDYDVAMPIEMEDGTYSLFLEDGDTLENDFEDYDTAKNWAIDNGWAVDSFSDEWPYFPENAMGNKKVRLNLIIEFQDDLKNMKLEKLNVMYSVLKALVSWVNTSESGFSGNSGTFTNKITVMDGGDSDVRCFEKIA